MMATAISTSSWSPKYPETFAAMRDRYTCGSLFEARVLGQEESYGYHYDLYGIIGGDDGLLRCIWHFVVAPFDQLFWPYLGDDLITIISNFRYICQRVTAQQLGWAEQGKLSCPAQAMKDFLRKHQVLHCDGLFLGGNLKWDSTVWRGLHQPPAFPRSA